MPRVAGGDEVFGILFCGLMVVVCEFVVAIDRSRRVVR